MGESHGREREGRFDTDRRADRGAGRLARRDAEPGAAIIRSADPEIVEEWKWAKATSPGTPVWSRDGIICTGETYKSVVKLTFMKGASLDDPGGLFNSSLEGNARRAIDIARGRQIDEAALKALSARPST